MPGRAIGGSREADAFLARHPVICVAHAPIAGSRTAAVRAFLEPLPAQRGPRERAVIRAALYWALPALRIDARLARRLQAFREEPHGYCQVEVTSGRVGR